MIKLVAAVSIGLILTGCASTRVEERREASTGMSDQEAIVLLGRASYSDRETETSFTDCVASALAKGERPLRLVTQKEFKDQLYPWFEPRTAPTSSKDLAKLFARPGVQKRIIETEVRYLAWISGDTITTDSGGSFSCTLSSFGGGCFGVSYWEEDASYEASIWDVENMTTSGQISADANGTSYLAGVILPIPIIARPGNAACKALANQLREFLQGSPITENEI
ncbi:hypothetical protein N8993_12115 [Pseudomonadales bacterium]|jgi:hypothetical protein|nr:hypothetical protein [Pseudomonadales bacterium]|tara:strand:+ start:891 stop:1562 length:672 start_codon:yes stop_codon:yes gene_type:complete